LPLVSIGLGLRTKPLLKVLGGTNPEPTGLSTARTVAEKEMKNTHNALNTGQTFITLPTLLCGDMFIIIPFISRLF
jgi:hypothetical protein